MNALNPNTQILQGVPHSLKEAPGFSFTKFTFPAFPGMQFVEAYGEPGSVLPTHRHKKSISYMGVKSGACKLLMDKSDPRNGETLRAGDYIFFDRGVVHGYQTDSKEGCSFFSVNTDQEGDTDGILQDGGDGDFEWVELSQR